ncbi:MAG TPA: hypothetical protein VHL11_17380 [Phototrophicaceae bacterium]|jgi:hypothetical protein|nr:hypothetical protein [Phototrophicaceae bacterium]
MTMTTAEAITGGVINRLRQRRQHKGNRRWSSMASHTPMLI